MKHIQTDHNYNHKCPINLKVLSKDDNAKLESQLLNKAKLYLRTKYNLMIIDKKYHLDLFTPQIIKLINDFNYYNNPNDCELLRVIETKFLKALNKHDDERRRIFSPNQIRRMIDQSNYQFCSLNNSQVTKRKMTKVIEQNKKQIEKRRMKEIKVLEQRKCEEEISKKVEQRLREGEMNYLKKVLTINKEGNEIKNKLEEKKQDCLIEVLYKDK